MAVGHIATYNGQHKSSAGVAATCDVVASVGDTLIAVVGCDDIANAEAIGLTDVTDDAGNTWTRLVKGGNTDNTAANATYAAIFGTVVTNAMAAGVVTFAPSASSAVKDMTVYRMSGLSLTIRGSNAGTGTLATPAALASASPLSGDFVLGVTVLEGPLTDTWTPDSDTTFGTWSTDAVDGFTAGTAITSITIHSQFKIVNANGTQTYNGANSTGRDWTRLLLVLAPNPPPASAIPPPVYVPEASIAISTGVGRVVAGQVDCYAIGPNFDERLPPVAFAPGVYNTAAQLTGFDLPGIQPIVRAIVDAGFVVVATTTLGSFGNTAGQTGIASSLSFARSAFACSNAPAVLIGFSEGGCDVMTYAFTNPTLVACVVGVIPIIDLSEIVEQNILDLGAAVLSAWGVGALPLPAGADPMTAGHQAILAQVPMQHWYATDDAVSANITSFQGGTGCDVRAVGPYGHSNESIARVWPTEIAKFIRKRVGTTRGLAT